jgi:hypothetical protein
MYFLPTSTRPIVLKASSIQRRPDVDQMGVYLVGRMRHYCGTKDVWPSLLPRESFSSSVSSGQAFTDGGRSSFVPDVDGRDPMPCGGDMVSIEQFGAVENGLEQLSPGLNYSKLTRARSPQRGTAAPHPRPPHPRPVQPTAEYPSLCPPRCTFITAPHHGAG